MKGLKKLISIIALIILIGTDFLNPISYALEQEDKIFGSKEDINLENNMEEEYTNESSEENLKNLEEDMIEKEEIENNSSKSEDNIDENEDNSFGENDSENEEEIYKSLEESSYIEKENLDESLLSSDEVGLSGENNTKGELDILEGVELSPIELVSDSIVDVEEEIIIKRTIELATAREILNEEEIIGQETYKNILVNVQAPAGTFPEGVELRISPITTKNEIKEIKEQIVDSQDNIEEEPELVAFDIAFLYTLNDGTEVELQPKDGESVQVTFDYSNNKIFKKAEVDDSQTIEVYHINDKNENGEKVEKGEEVVEKIEINQNASEEIDNALVIDAENFSIYVLTLTPTDTFTLTLDPGAGRIVTGNNIIVDENSGTGTIQDVNGEVVLPAARRANYLLSGWYTQLDEYIGNAGSGYNVTENITLYAQWKCDINQGYNDDGHGGCVATSKDILAQMPGFTYGTDYEISITRPASLSGDDSYADSPVTYTIMDRNLGATSNDISSTDSYGYYYQYGNNYGFNWLPESVWKYDDMYGNIDLSSYGPSNPFYQGPYFIKGRAYAEADYEDDWATVSNIGIWGGNAIKESNRKGPCPEGYHIPTQKEWIDLEAYYVETYGSDTEDFRTYFKLPLPGSLARSTALGEKNYGTEGFYRTTSLVHTASGYNAYAFKVKSGEDNSTYANNRVNGYSIRCFKNDDTIYTVTYNDGVNDEEVFNQLGTGYRGDYFPDFVGEPGWTGKTFKGWFMESDGDYIHVNPSTVQITSNLTVYAKWSSCAEGKCVVPAEEIITGYGDLDIYFVENDDANTTRHYTTLDRDVGASQLGVAGYQYQWGNNHGFKACTTSKCNSFPGGEIPNSNQVDISGYDPITNPYNSETYIKQSTKDANWATGNVNRKDNLWGGISGTNAAMQGPCPNGYHIPTSGDWEDIYASWSDINFGRDGCKNGSLKTCATKLVEDLLLTPHGRRDHEAKVDYLTAASYWSSSPVSSSTTAYGVYLNDQEKTDSKAVQISNIDGRIRARAVRCVKNEYNTPLIIKINGGTGASLSVYSGSLHYLTNPTKEGYEFSGWYSNLTGNVKIEDGSTLPQGTTTLYAKWIGNNEAEYIFNASGGTFSSTATEELVHIYTLNDVINSEDIEIPVRSGFDFAGWYDELGNLFEFPLTATGNLNLYAHWNATTAVNVTVNYRLKDLDVEHNVLTGTSTVYVSGVIFTGLADDIVNISTKYGTGINGYEYSKSIVYGSDFSGGVETEITTVLGDGSRVIDMYYIPKKYDFTLNSASYSSTEGSSESTGYYYGANVTLSGDSSDDCFSWSGWTTSGITLSDSTLPQTWFTMPANDVEVTPSVTEKTYNIIFSGNGSTSGEMNPINGVMCTQSIQLTQNAFEKTSYIFTGWSRNSGSNTREYTDRQTVSGLSKTNLDDVVLYAVWDRNDFEVRIVSNNESYGTVSSGSVTKPYGTSISVIGNTLSIGGTTVTATAGTAPAGHTYTFSGWTLSNECESGLNYAVAEGCAITGNFEDEINEYEVTWKNWNNAILATRMVTYGDHPVYTGADPKRSREDPAESEYDFIFTGWTKNGDSQIIKDLSTEVVTGTVTYTAHYDQVYRNYIVKYNANGGLGTMQDQDLQLHTSGTLATNTFEKLGYNFAGWLSQSGGVSYTDGQEINLSINDVESSILTDDLFLNLQAQWTPKTDIKVTVNYYLKKIDPANNILIDGVDVYLTGVEYTGTSDSTVNIFSKYWTGIVGYDYDNATVFSGGERTGATETTVLPDGSREINMYYIPHKYNFTLNSDSYSSTAGSSESTGYYYGVTVTLSGDSNDDCFMWSGWTTSGITLSDATLHQTGFAMPANAVEVSSVVKEKTYNVIFNGGDDVQGSMENLSGVMCTENITLNNNFSKIGHTFTGWSITSGGAISYTSGQVVSGLSKTGGYNVNLYAVWDINNYEVTGSVATGQENMGYLSGESTTGSSLTGLYEYGRELIFVAVPELGYLFDYWEVNNGTGDNLPEGVTASGNQLTVIVDQILDIVAHFKPDIKTVTVNHFQENIGGGYTLYETESNFTGYVGNEFVASEKKYSGFVSSGNNNKTIIISGNDSSNVINLYYERNKYHLHVSHGDGTNVQITPSCTGSSNYYNCEYYYDDEISISVVGGYEEGYSYSGWYNDQEYPLPIGTQLNENGTLFRMPNNDVHLYLDITHNLYKLTFTGYEGTDISNVDTVTVDLTGENYFRFNDEIELPYLNKPGYNFVGWNSGDYNEWGVLYTLEPYHPIWHMPSHDVELTAEFTGRTDMEYYKYYYFQKTEGSGYVLSGDERFDDGITDQRVSSNCKYVEGFTYSRGEPDILYIKATGDNYINCYYDRDEYWVDVIYDNKELSVDGTGKYRYDAPVNLIATANTGYEFNGFSSEQPEYNTTSSTLSFNVPLGGPYSIYADANPIEYSIEYELDGGNYNPSWYENPTIYTIENPDIPLLNPEKDGYKFLGWTGGVISGGIEGEDDIVEPTRDLIITGGSIGDRKYYANWEPDEVKVTVNYYLKKLNTGDNVLIDGVDIYREGVIFTGIADRMVNISGTYLTGIVGYHYDHATVFSGGERIGATETTVLPNGSREINMYYIPNKYNFTLNSDLHSSTVGSSESAGYYYGANVILSGDSDKDCFTWSGWIINGINLSDATLQYTGFTMPANDVEVTPSVREKIYNIIFNGNGNISGEMLPMNGVKCTESTGLTLNIFEKKGYTFTGWSTISGDNIREYTDGQIVSGLSKNDLENVNLYAVWDINWYTVTFDLNGGFLTGDMTETTGYTIKTPSISLENYIPIKSGYTLIGWYKGDTLVDHIAGGEIGDYILDAHWKADSDTLYTVKYYKENLNGGYDVWTGIYIGETDIEITALVKDFTGFTYSGGNEKNVTTGVIAGDGSLVLKLYYDRNKYPIIWKDGNGETLKTENLFYEMIPEYTGNIPTKTKTPQYTYIFNDKWLPNIESVTTGATYIAQFDAIVNSYTINIVPNNTDFGTISTGEINVEYGVTIVESGNKMIIGEIEIEANPNPADIQYTYEFDNWTNTCGQKLIGTCTLQANFKRILNKYTITWRNEDGSVIDATQVEYGKKPTHTNPTKSDTEDYSYIFVGWTPEILPVIGNAEYTAIFKPEEKEKSGGGGMSGGGRKGNDVDSQHGSAEENVGGNEYTGEEVLDDFNNNIVPLYKWSYENKITTINTLEEANPDGLVTRGHLAKMVVNYMINVLGRKVPYDVTYNCVHRGDNESSRESDEIRDYATKACAFGVMGINMENNEFLPNNIVTRAEFGTVISRMLRGDKYDIIDTDNKRYYENHLQVLKKDDILTQISNPEARWEIRKWVWLVFRRIIEKKK